MSLNEATTELDLLKEAARSAFWDVLYHEKRFATAVKRLSAAKSLMARMDMQFTAKDAQKAFEDDEDGEEIRTSEDLMRHIYGNELHSVAWHESQLAAGNGKIAAVKAMVARSNYSSEISLNEIRAAVFRRMNEHP